MSMRLMLLVALFFTGLQTAGAVHAMEHGDDPHEHDGAPCHYTLLGSREYALPAVPPELPPPPARDDIPDPVVFVATSPAACWTLPASRAPPCPV